MRLTFLVYVATIQCLKQNRQEPKKKIGVRDSVTSVTFKQCQGHQIWYEVVDLKQTSYHEKFERPRLNIIHEKANIR